MKALIFSLAVMALGSACGDDGGAQPGHDAGVIDAPHVGTPDASCFTNPTTPDQIINACTNAEQIFKNSHPPLLNPDGSLPALPP